MSNVLRYPRGRKILPAGPGLIALTLGLWTLPAGGSEPIVAPASLRPTADVPLILTLDLPAEPDRAPPSWDEVHVARCIMRSGGEQKSLLPLTAAAGGRDATVTPGRAGPALLAISIGPAEDSTRSDAWQRVTHCIKIIFDVQAAPGSSQPAGQSAAGLTAKVGQRIEIVPLIDPRRVRVGDDLPVRVFFDGAKVVGADVQATIRPANGGDQVEVRAAAPTDAEGTTRLPITQAGTWLVRFTQADTKPVADEAPDAPTAPVTCVAELLFAVAAGEKP